VADPSTFVVGTDAIIVVQFSGAGTYSAGTGLTLTGTVFSITDTGVAASTYGSASSVPVIAVNAQGQVTSASSSSIAIAASQITSGALAIANGGTGATDASGALSNLGAYPASNPSGFTSNTGTVTSVNLTAGTGVSVSGGPITASGSITVTNTAPDQVVSLTGSGATTVTGTYPNFTISSPASGAGTVTSIDVSGGTTGLTTSGGPVTTSGTITLAGTLNVANGGTGATTLSSGYVLKGNGTSAVSASVIYDDGTNVGIGTASPADKLHVAATGTAYGSGYIVSRHMNTAGEKGVFLGYDADENAGTIGGANFLTFQTYNAANAWGERMRIDREGNVSITGSGNGTLTLGSSAGAYSSVLNMNSSAGGGSAITASQFLGVHTAGTERMRINASGNVGIGTTSQTIKLQVSDVDQATARIGVQNLNGQNYQLVAGNHGLSNSGFAIFDATASATRMYFDSSGNVGIGSTDPVSYAGYGNLTLQGTNGGTLTLRNNANTTSGEMASAADEIYLKNVAAKPLWFGTNNTERMRITSAGDVGIGTASPSAKLNVVGNTLISLANSYFCYTNDYGIGTPDSNGLQVFAASGDTMRFGHRASNTFTERMRIDSSGNLLVGGTSVLQSAKITAYGSVAAQNGGVDGTFANAFVGVYSANSNEHNVIQTSVSSVGTGSGFRFRASLGGGSSTTYPVLDLTRNQTIFYTDNAERARIDSSGNLLVGTTAATGKLVCAGTLSVLDSSSVGYQTAIVSTNGLSKIDAYQSGNQALAFNTTASGSSTERMRITSAGRVGIGTTTPTEQLSLTGSIRVGSAGTVFSNSYTVPGNTQTWLVNNSSSEDTYITTDTAQRYRMLTGTGHQWELAPSGTVGTSATFSVAMKLDLGGNLGIGTASPNARLALAGATGSTNGITLAASGWAYFGRIGMNGTSGGEQYWTANYSFATSAVDSAGEFSTYIQNSAGQGIVAFGTSSAVNTAPTERMRINAAGNVGIGTSSPVGKLTTVSTAGFAAPNLLCTDTVGNFRIVFNTGSYAGVPANKPWLHSYDDIYVGSDANTTFNVMSGGVNTFKVDSSGNAIASGQINSKNTALFIGDGADNSATVYATGGPVKFFANASEAMRLTSAGNLIINESAQVAYGGNTPKLEVLSASIPSSDADGGSLALIGSTNTAGAGGALVLGSLFQTGAWGTFGRVRGSKDNSTAGNYGGGIAFDTRANGSNFAQRMLLDSSGNLGVGTDAPAVRLSVLTGSNYAATFNTTTIPSSSTAISIGGYTTAGGGGGGSVAVRGYHNHGATAGSSMAFEVNGSTEVMRIDGGTLNVGIGTSAPAAKLQVIGSVFSQIAVDGSNASGVRLVPAGSGEQFVRFVTSDGSNRAAISGQDDGGGPGSLRFYTANSLAAMTQRMLIDNAGNVGVGNSAIPYTTGGRTVFNVNGSSSALISVQSAGANRGYFYGDGSTIAIEAESGCVLKLNTISAQPMTFFTSNTERARISAAGGFSVGTTADPGAGAIYATGNITAYYSDDRLKTRLGDIDDALGIIDKIDAFYYEANETAKELGYEAVREVGVSAQSVQRVLPEVVAPAPIDAEYLTVRYERLVPVLIQAIKELTARVAQLEGK
jgi:hypothetical protein